MKRTTQQPRDYSQLMLGMCVGVLLAGLTAYWMPAEMPSTDGRCHCEQLADKGYADCCRQCLCVKP